MKKIIILIFTLIFSATALASYQPCVPNADFCVQFVNESSSPATVKSLSNVGFAMPGVQGLIISAHTITQYIPVFGGPQAFMLGEGAPWTLVMKPAHYPELNTNCIMSYTNPVIFQPVNCGVALSQPNPYDLVVKFNFFSMP